MAMSWKVGDRVKAVFDTDIYVGTVEALKRRARKARVVFDDGDVLDLNVNELLPEFDEDDEESRGFNQYPVNWDKDRVNFTIDVQDGMGNEAHFYGHWRRAVFQNNVVGFAVDMWCRYGEHPYSVESCFYIEDPREKPSSLNADICAMVNKFLHQRLDDCAMTLDDLRKKADQPILQLRTIEELDEIIMALREFRSTGARCGGERCHTIAVSDGRDERTPKIGLRLNFTNALSLTGNQKGDPNEQPLPAASAKTKRKGRRAKAGASSVATKPTGNVASLIEQLKSSTDKAEKRRLRAALRAAGHRGGLKS